jgi:hypothetical protein
LLPIQIGLATRSATVDFPSLVKVAGAINVQVSRDLSEIWGVKATVNALPDPQRIDPGIYPVYVVDHVEEDLAGFHQTDHNQPYALVEAGDTWSLTASHECIEMLVDPSGNRLIASTAIEVVDNEIRDAVGKFEYLLEVCDPSEDASNAYLIGDVLVADFYTPRFFDPIAASGVRYSFTGKITRPRQVLPNGYLSWLNPATGSLQQVRHFGAPIIVDLPGQVPAGAGLAGKARTLRGIIDSQTKAPFSFSRLRRSEPLVARSVARRDWLSSAATARAASYPSLAPAVFATREAVPAAAGLPDMIHENLDTLSRPGVISVRPGFAFAGGWITQRRVIVVYVKAESLAAAQAALPASLKGVPIDVRAATPAQVKRADEPAVFDELSNARHELRLPQFDGEVLLAAPSPAAAPALAPAGAEALAHHAKQRIEYTPAPDVTLDEVTEEVTLLLHVSPDAGWANLSAFLAGVRQELTVGMYDFTAAHILAAIEQDLARKALTLTLDHPPKNPTSDQSDDDTVKALRQQLGAGFKQAWALTDASRKAPVWIYPNAYHIKVAVREDDTFWLSSGNWNKSNQPQIDLSDEAGARLIAAHSDRDWHVIATSSSLAKVFRAFLAHDYKVASLAEAAAAQAAAGLGMAVPQAPPPPDIPADLVAAVGRQPMQFFPPLKITGRIRIQPLLTPDNYQEQVLSLIRSAQSRFYMQTQYIHPSAAAADQAHAALIAAVQDRIGAGVDVKLITSQWQNADWIEKLAEAGLDTSVLRIQPNVHNKGIVVDSKVTVVSSQNWSADGTLRNRDAGLIIWDERAAQYFESIFLHDWNHLAAARTS